MLRIAVGPSCGHIAFHYGTPRQHAAELTSDMAIAAG